MNVGFIGLGRMGALMARNLMDAGHALFVHDIDRAACDGAVDAGATWAGSPAEAARQATIVVSSVPGPREVAAVMTGPDGVLAGIAVGALVIEHRVGEQPCPNFMEHLVLFEGRRLQDRECDL